MLSLIIRFCSLAFDRSGLELNLERRHSVGSLFMRKRQRQNKVLLQTASDVIKNHHRLHLLLLMYPKALNTSDEGDAHNALNDVLLD